MYYKNKINYKVKLDEPVIKTRTTTLSGKRNLVQQLPIHTGLTLLALNRLVYCNCKKFRKVPRSMHARVNSTNDFKRWKCIHVRSHLNCLSNVPTE